MKREIEIDVCSLCKGLWLTLDDVCPCSSKQCYSDNQSASEGHYKEFDDYIDAQVQLVRGLLFSHDILPGEKVKISYNIEAVNNSTGIKQ